MAEHKEKKSIGKKIIVLCVVLGVVAAMGIGLAAARFVSGRSILELARPGVAYDDIELTEDTTQEKSEAETEAERYTGINDDRTYFLDDNGKYIPEYETVEESTYDPELFYTQDGRIYYNWRTRGTA